jgi:predicted 2-oxoglutarate/Fe(II)-dependent dioxygenase YbiX
MHHTTYQNSPLIQVWDDVFTPAQCQGFIDLSHQHAYETATITISRSQAEQRLNVRNNQRVIYDDEQLAQILYARLSSLLPQQLHGWNLAGLNERFRFYLYENGQTFKPHYDASYEKNEWHSSQLSLLIYLSEDFSGGETIFYHDSGMRKPCVERRNVEIQPKMGQVLLFEHQQLHEGAPVVTGQKYVLRTDVMYQYPLR